MSTSQKLTKIGVPIPHAIAHVDKLRSAVYNDVLINQPRDIGELIGMLKEGTASVDAVRAMMLDLGPSLAALAGFREHREQIHLALEAGERAALVSCTDELFASMRPRVVELGHRLTDAVGILGSAPDTHTVGRMGPAAGKYWTTYNECLQGFQAIWTLVCDTFAARRVQGPAIPRLVWIELTDDLTLDDVDRVNEAGTPQAIAALGCYAFDLNTPDVVSKFLDDLKRKADAEPEAA